MPVPVFDPIDFANSDKPYEGGGGYVEKLLQLSANFSTLRDYNAEVQLSVEGQTAALLAGTEEDRLAAEASKDSSYQNALSANAAAGQATDSTANIAAILKSRGITNIKAIAFKSAEGWEKEGNQAYKNETRPTGRFLGDYANVALAWAASYQGVPSVNGDVYWDTTDKTQYELIDGNSRTINYRFGSAEMPAACMIVAAGASAPSAMLHIFDLTDPLIPRWMAFLSTASTFFGISATPNSSGVQICYGDGVLVVGKNNGAGTGLIRINFKTGIALYMGGSYEGFLGTLEKRNTATSIKTINTSNILPSGSVLDLAKFGAYTAVTTDAGEAIIKPDGIVVKSSSTNAFKANKFLNARLYAINDTASPEQLIDFGPPENLGASFTAVNTWTSATVPALSASTLVGIADGKDCLAILSASAVDFLWPNPADYQSSLIARKGLNYATPPMKKPLFIAICGTTEGVVSDAETLTDGGFTGDGSAWSRTSAVTYDAVNDELDYDGAGFGYAQQSVAYSEGEILKIEVTVTNATSGWYRVRYGSNGSDTYNIAASAIPALNGTVTYYRLVTPTMVAGDGKIHVTFAGAGSLSISAVSVTRVMRDFSGLSNYFFPVGSLTFTSATSGAVAGASGFSAANYLYQPYNAALDVGTGDICIAFAFKSSGNSTDEALMSRGDLAMANYRFVIFLMTDGTVRASTVGATTVTTSSTSTYDDGLPHTGLFYRRGGVGYLEIDGQVVASAANAVDLTNLTAVVRVGVRPDGASPSTTSRIWFAGASASAPTATEAAEMHKWMRQLTLNKANFDAIPSAATFNPQTGAFEMAGATNQQSVIDGAVKNVSAHGRGSSPVIACGSRGEVSVGGTTGHTVSVPARNLREYTARKVKERFTVKYLGDSSRTKFPDPAIAAEIVVTIGAKPVRVVDNGVVLVEGASDAYTVKDGGLGRYFANIAVAPGATKVIVTFEREVWR